MTLCFDINKQKRFSADANGNLLSFQGWLFKLRQALHNADVTQKKPSIVFRKRNAFGDKKMKHL